MKSGRSSTWYPFLPPWRQIKRQIYIAIHFGILTLMSKRNFLSPIKLGLFANSII